MKKIGVLIACGAGASSTFLAMSLRKAAADRGINMHVIARGVSEIDNYIDQIDAVLVAPHMAYEFDTIMEIYGEEISVILMDRDYFVRMDGAMALEHILKNL